MEWQGGKGRFDLATMVGWLILRGWGNDNPLFMLSDVDVIVIALMDI